MAAPTYSVAGHASLSTQARALAPEALAGFNRNAEVILTLRVGAYNGQDAEGALDAVVEQVNYLVNLGAGAGALSSESTGGQAVVVARNPKSGEAQPLSPVARDLWTALIAAAAPPPAPTAPAVDLNAYSSSTPNVVVW